MTHNSVVSEKNSVPKSWKCTLLCFAKCRKLFKRTAVRQFWCETVPAIVCRRPCQMRGRGRELLLLVLKSHVRSTPVHSAIAERERERMQRRWAFCLSANYIAGLREQRPPTQGSTCTFLSREHCPKSILLLRTCAALLFLFRFPNSPMICLFFLLRCDDG